MVEKSFGPQDELKIRGIQSLLAAFTQVYPSMPIQIAQTFLLVAIHEGCSLTDLMKRSGWVQSTLSRHLLDLGERNRFKEPGLGLVISRKDPMNLRKNIYTLTPKGRMLVNTLLNNLAMIPVTGDTPDGDIS